MEEKSRAEDLARRVAAVRTVSNNLKIQSQADNVNMATEIQESDKQMKHEVEDGQSQHVEAIKGEGLRIEGDTYFVKGEGEKKVRLHTDPHHPKDRRH
jgi:lactam utilization protein B